VQITASPFYYGLMKAIYRPLVNLRGNTSPADASNRYFINISQLPHVDIQPNIEDSYEMTLPFIYHQNYVNLQSNANVKDLGQLNFYCYSQLKSANGATGTGVTVAIYAWFDEVELSGASAGYSMQSDEYGEGPVSKPATWVADAASYFENIPVIGPFATATKIGAGAISAIARLFGFTNVPVIEDTKPVRNENFPKLASSEIGFPLEKLTFDPKTELSVDPRIIGMDNGIDEMCLSYITSKESYLTSINWSSADALDTMLFYSRVNPLMFDIDAAANPAVFMSPMAMVSRSFADWRGSIIFRFHFVASKYHKGKVIISFDPSGYNTKNIGVLTNTSNVVYTAIVDLGETKDIEFEVPYQQAVQFLNIRGSFIGTKNWAVKTTYPATHIYSPDYDNGIITMRVLNTLTAPEATSDVDILVYVRGGKDLEFNNPAPIGDTGAPGNILSFYAPQSEEMTTDDVETKEVMAPTASIPDKQFLVHYGENIRSLRTLLRRYNHLQTEAFQTPAVGEYGDFYKYLYRFPITPGYTSLATTLANKIVGTGTAGFNFCNMTTLGWYSNAYLCYRGSTNWTFNPDTPLRSASLTANRTPYSNVPATSGSGIAAILSTNTINQYLYTQGRSGTSGMALTNTHTQPGLNINNPSYSRFKYQYCSPTFSNQGSAIDASNQGLISVNGFFGPYSTNATRQYGCLSTYVASGVDFGLYFFLNTPIVYVYTTAITYA
jgi:hypothetical protein